MSIIIISQKNSVVKMCRGAGARNEVQCPAPFQRSGAAAEPAHKTTGCRPGVEAHRNGSGWEPGARADGRGGMGTGAIA